MADAPQPGETPDPDGPGFDPGPTEPPYPEIVPDPSPNEAPPQQPNLPDDGRPYAGSAG